MKLLITGGHLTPALAVIDYFQSTHPEIEVVFIGRRFSQEVSRQRSQEETEVRARHLSFIPLSAPRLSWQRPLSLLALPFLLAWSVIRAWSIVRHERPDLFLSFGGYLAVPVALACWLQRTPIVTHEQTRTVSFTTRILARVAQRIAVSFPETAQALASPKTTVTGNPLRSALFKAKAPAPSWFDPPLEKPLLYITGGNQGSQMLNAAIAQSIASFVPQWTVIHQCGRASPLLPYTRDLEQARKRLPKTEQGQYFIREWLTTTELAWVYHHADLVVSRSGANTVAELVRFNLPSIFIPLPFSRKNEQLLNAQWAVKHVRGEILLQKDCTPERLSLVVNRHRPKKTHRRRAFPRDDGGSAIAVAELVLSVASTHA